MPGKDADVAGARRSGWAPSCRASSRVGCLEIRCFGPALSARPAMPADQDRRSGRARPRPGEGDRAALARKPPAPAAAQCSMPSPPRLSASGLAVGPTSASRESCWCPSRRPRKAAGARRDEFSAGLKPPLLAASVRPKWWPRTRHCRGWQGPRFAGNAGAPAAGPRDWLKKTNTLQARHRGDVGPCLREIGLKPE